MRRDRNWRDIAAFLLSISLHAFLLALLVLRLSGSSPPPAAEQPKTDRKSVV